MICTVIKDRDFDGILDLLDDPFVEMAEVRLDSCALDDGQIEELFGDADKPLIATCRASALASGYGDRKWDEALRRLRIAIEAGAQFADLELDAPAPVSKSFRRLCEENDTRIIRSWHDDEGTPDAGYLLQLVERCFRYGADIAKVVTTFRKEHDDDVVLGLYGAGMSSGFPVAPERLVAFAMGERGRDSRYRSLALGAPFAYACVSEQECAAPGQVPFEEMHRKVYGDTPAWFWEDLEMPCSKSFAQRAILAAALAEGTSKFRGYNPCEDSESAISVAKALGAKVSRRGSVLSVTGIGPIAGELPLEKVDAGESGLLARLMIPLAATLGTGHSTVSGRGTLLSRPLPGAADIMASFGVMLKGTTAPVEVCGKLIPGTAEISGRGGSQLISGLLMALPLCAKASTLHVSDPRSLPYMFITVDVLRRFGVNIDCELEGDTDRLSDQDWSGCTGVTFRIRKSQAYRAAEFDLEGDWSSAANFLVAGAVFGCAGIVGVDLHSLQADLSILSILVEAGASVSVVEEEGFVSVRKAPLEPFDADLNNAPDLFPAVAVLAAFCPGESHIHGLGRLSGKESRRDESILSMLSAMGVDARRDGDTLTVCGRSLASRGLTGTLLKGGSYPSYSDHRMVMALSVASLGTESPLTIDNPGCVAKSFPEFFTMFHYFNNN